ncbi:MAG: hypothetical protein KBF88_00695, partial [Polyangiaceae bacterium]|nr:hypothetical protein [Polyangiaceae bacterium]
MREAAFLRWVPRPNVRWIAMAVLATSAAGAEETRVDLGGGAAMVLVRVQAGTFRQGSEPSDPDRES